MSLTPVSFKRGRQFAPRLSKPYVPGVRDERYWTDEEKEIVRKYYPIGGAPACLAHLSTKRKAGSVYQQAQKLGLNGPRKEAGAPRQKHDASPELDETIKREWALLDGRKRGAVNDLADRLELPRWWLTKRATKLGLTMPHKKEPLWTAAEDALMSKVPLHDPDRCAEIFREHGFSRSPTAIMVHAKRVGLSRRFKEGLSGRAAAKIIGLDDKTLTAYCISGELKATKRDDNRLPQQGGSRWVIKPVDLRQFVIDNLGRIDFRKVDKFDLVRLLTTEGESPAARGRGWTIAEDNIVRGGYARKLTIPQVIDELEASGFKRRSLGSVSARAQFLGCTSQRFSDAWSDREDQILRDAYAASVRIADIVGLLEDEGFNRSRGAIQMRAIVLRISVDRVKYWTDEEKRIALDGLRAGKTHGEVREDLAAAGYVRGPTAMFKFAQKHRVVRKPEGWSDEQVERLRSCYAAMMPVKEIAAELGKTIAGVRTKASELGLKQRLPWTDEERQLLVDCHAAGRTAKVAAAAIGRPYANVVAESRRMHLSFFRPASQERAVS